MTRPSLLSLLLPVLLASCLAAQKPLKANNATAADPFISVNLQPSDEGGDAEAESPKTSEGPNAKLGGSILGTLTAELVPHPGRELSLSSGAKVTLVTLRDLSNAKSETSMIDRRSKAAPRESLNDLKVLGACAANVCTDGLLDQKSKALLLQEKPSQDELSLAKNGWVERLLRIATVGEDHASLYLGRVVTQNNSTIQALLECATYQRSSGQRLSVKQLLPPQRYSSMLRQARERLAEQHPTYQIDPRSFLLRGPLPNGITFCALPPAGSNEAQIVEVSL